MAKTYNLFISHSWAYGDAYEKITDFLDARPYFSYQNFLVPKDDPIHTKGTDKQLYQAIKNKIQLTHVVIIMAGVYSTYSKWINHEIDIAQKHSLRKHRYWRFNRGPLTKLPRPSKTQRIR